MNEHEVQSPPRTAVVSGLAAIAASAARTMGMTIVPIGSPNNSVQTTEEEEGAALEYDLETPTKEDVRDPYPSWWAIGSC